MSFTTTLAPLSCSHRSFIINNSQRLPHFLLSSLSMAVRAFLSLCVLYECRLSMSQRVVYREKKEKKFEV
jgi:hypothetical protein